MRIGFGFVLSLLAISGITDSWANQDDGGPCLAAPEKTGVVAGTLKVTGRYRKTPSLVYIEEIPGRKFEAPKEAKIANQKNKEFIPRVLPVLAGTTVEFHNDDDFEHNVNSPDQEKFDLGNWGKGLKRSYTFKRAGVYTLLCTLHPEMVGYVLALKAPYFAFADKDGKFRIEKVPPGKWKLRTWNERFSPKKLKKTFDVTVEAGKEADVTIKP